MSSLLKGRAGEARVADDLRRRGWKLLAAGYRCRFGEIDLIARKGRLVVFVEVKLRRNADFAPAWAAVTAQKQERLRKTAACWLAEDGGDWDCRFDIAEVYTETDELHYIENAFQ